MKSMSLFSQFRRSLKLAVLVCFAFQQIAFASPATLGAPLSTPHSEHQAGELMGHAEYLLIADYFRNGGTAVEITRFNSDLLTLAKAFYLVGSLNDLDSFNAWYTVNQATVIMNRDQSHAQNLNGFLADVLIRYHREKATSKEDPYAFLLWLNTQFDNPAVRSFSASAFTVAAFVAGGLVATLKGAMTAGPAGRVANSYFDPVVRPIAEKVGLKGADHLGGLGIRLNAHLFQKTGSKKAAAEELNRLMTEIRAAQGEGFEATRLNAEMGYDITAAGHLHNMEYLRGIWSKTNLVWQNTNPSTFRDGRDVFTNAISQRPQQDAVAVMVSRQGAVQAQQSIEAIIERIIDRKKLEPQMVEDKVVKLLRLVELKGNAVDTNSEAAKAELEGAKASLRELGATEFQVERLIESRFDQLVYARNTAHALAANWIRETQFAEFNINLPDEVDQIQRTLRQGNVLTFFHHEFKAEVTEILKSMNFMVDEAKAVVKAATDAPNSPLRADSTMPEVSKKERRTVREKISDTAGTVRSRLRLAPRTCEAIF
jgi:hypothetical protein